MFLDFVKGLAGAVGFASGLSLMKAGETRAVTMKRWILSVFYIVGIFWSIWSSFSYDRSEDGEHVFISALSVLKININPDGWMFLVLITIWVAFLFSCLLLTNFGTGKKIYDLNKLQYLVCTLLFAFWNYVFVYDLIFRFGNGCVAGDVFCFNFHYSASVFAGFSTALYMLRSFDVNRYNEISSLTFFGSPVKEIKNDDAMFLPTAPVPHFVWVLFILMYDKCPLFWDSYHNPDGRETVQQINHVHFRGQDVKK